VKSLLLVLVTVSAAACAHEPTNVHGAATARMLPTLSLSVGQSGMIGPKGVGYDSLPALSSSAVAFLGMSYFTAYPPEGPAVQRQEFYVVAMAPGQIVATIFDTAGAPAVQDTITVQAALPHGAFAQVSAGFFLTTCAVTTRGAGYCWGKSSQSTLSWDAFGDNAYAWHDIPMAVPGGLTFAAISGGGQHTCGLTTGGAAYCWGADFNGQLGNGNTADTSAPVAVTGGLTFKAVSAGIEHTCGLTTGGAIYCWGNNVAGELGNGAPGYPVITPTVVLGGLTFAAVGAGYDDACGLTTGGAAYCWGYNKYGELGNGDTTVSTVPVAVAGGLSFVALSTGYFHTCGLASGGRAYCWGGNFAGELGNGTTTASSTPVAVSRGLTFAAISAGQWVTCGVTTSGAAYCWGWNGAGQLGNGTTTYTNPAPVPVSGGLTFTTVSAGYLHTCGVTTTGAIYCWGDNSEGELGNSSTWSTWVSLTPVPVSGP
jgi:alpha-tubulin suppressor-like RCC1 family protein